MEESMQNYTKEFKIQVVTEYQKLKVIDYVLKKYKIAHSTLFDWASRYRELTDKTEYTLDDYLNLNIIISLDRSTFYNYYSRRVKKQFEIKKTENKKAIIRIFEESGQRFGSTKIYQKMRAEGFKLDNRTVSCIYKELGLINKQCKKKSFIPQKDNRYGYLKNKLNQKFSQSEPNKFWVSDTTSIWVANNRFHLCTIIDLFSRKVIAYRLSSQYNSSLTINTLKDAFEQRNRPTGVTFHSDKGSSYVATEFRALLHSLKFEQSCSKKGTPYDNAVAESFFSNLKRDEINSHNFEFFEEMKECVDEYMKFYNGYRPHSFLKKTPNQVEEEFYNV